MFGRWLPGGLALTMLIGAPPVGAQIGRPLTPLPADGLRVTPYFDGWYANPDGTFTLSFGYSNLNKDELVEIPLGPDNFIEPKEFDGRQPTSFPAIPPESGGDGGRGGDRRERARGVFTVTVPKGFQGDVVWTLRNRGQTFKVPGHAKSGAYQLSWPMAMGSIPPLLSFRPDGPTGRGPTGIQADPVQTTVGKPVSITVWLKDDSVREPEPVAIKREAKAKMNVTWYKHSGPGPVVFTPSKEPIPELEGRSSTSATFKAPGEYVIRVRGDNFGSLDSTSPDQCCWTNGYVRVTVTP